MYSLTDDTVSNRLCSSGLQREASRAAYHRYPPDPDGRIRWDEWAEVEVWARPSGPPHVKFILSDVSDLKDDEISVAEMKCVWLSTISQYYEDEYRDREVIFPVSWMEGQLSYGDMKAFVLFPFIISSTSSSIANSDPGYSVYCRGL